MAVHVPPYHPGRRLGALIVLHGAGGSGDQVLPYFTALGDRLSMAVLAPTAQQLAQASHNFDLAGIFGSRFSMPRWDLAGQDFPLAALRWARTTLGVDSDRCVLTGVSMGGLATWNLGMRFWPSFAAAIPLNGALSIWESFGPDTRTRALLPNTLPLPLFVVHGGKDERIPAEFDRESVRTLRHLGHQDVEYVEVPDGAHGLDTLGLVEDRPLFQRIEHWLERARRGNQPLEIHHRADEDAHGRAHWVGLSGIVPRQSGEVHARWTVPDRIDIAASGAERVALYLRGDRIAPGHTVTVEINGSVSKVPFEPDLATVQRTFWETADSGLVAEQVVHLDVPQLPGNEPTEPNNQTRYRDADSI
jgi:predicted esterase